MRGNLAKEVFTSVFINGVSGVNGEPLLSNLDIPRIAAFARGDATDGSFFHWLRNLWRTITSLHLGPPLGVDLEDPLQVGWAIVFHSGESSSVREALSPLIEHRRTQLGAKRVKILEYQTGEQWRQWLARHGVEPGTILPPKVPYYVLLVGDPEQIPYELEHLLSVEYAVGRLSFDHPEEYRRYAESLIGYERSSVIPNSRSAVFFGTKHELDPSTEMSADLLVGPLSDGVPADGDDPAEPPVAERWGFSSRKLSVDAATKANLGEVFCPPDGVRPPAFLFSATHGVGWPKGHPDQIANQGALLCQDWSGFGDISPGHYYAAADVPEDARVHGMICFHFACYGLGTPRRDRFIHEPGKEPPEIAERSFVASLPKRLLTHPQGSALAIIGHVERAWGYSILGASGGAQILPFRNTIGGILKGWPVGHALKDFRLRYAALSSGLSTMLETIGNGGIVPDKELAEAWMERNDAEAYGLAGDPVARLRVEVMT